MVRQAHHEGCFQFRLLVLPIVHQVVDHRRVGQGRGIAQLIVLVGGDLAQDAAHDLARARFRQRWRPLQQVGRGDRADFGAHELDQFVVQFVVLKSVQIIRILAVVMIVVQLLAIVM